MKFLFRYFIPIIGNNTDLELGTTLKRDFLFTNRVIGNNVFMLLNQGIGPTTEGEPFIDGARFAQEAYYWKAEGKNITVKINCLGGRVLHGWDMIDAIIECQAETFGAGVAYSMAGMCLIAGKNRRAYSHASAMIHAPHSITGRASNPLTDVMKGQFKTLLEARTKFSKQEVEELMNGKDHFFTAAEMKEKGMIDDIAPSGLNIPVNASAEELYSFYNNSIEDFKPKKEDMDFKSILAKLTGKTDEAEGIVAVTEMKSQIEKHNAEKTAWAAEKASYEAKIKTLEDAGKASDIKAKATELINVGEKAGKLKFKDAAEKEKAIENATANFDGYKMMIDAIPASKPGSVASFVSNDKPEQNTYEWLAKNDPKKLNAIAETDPELFNKLSDEYIAKQKEAANK